jgi:glycerophosphoryl diester phosphodiesterase
MTAAELSEVLVQEPRLADRRRDIGVPTLAQAVSLLAAYPAANAFIELRRATLRASGCEIFVRKVCDALKPVARQCVIVSHDLAAVHHVRQTTSYRIGWILPDYATLSALKCEALAPDYVFCDQQLLTENNSKLWRGPWRWAIYDVNSRTEALHLANRDARLIATPNVRTMLREFRNLRAQARE